MKNNPESDHVPAAAVAVRRETATLPIDAKAEEIVAALRRQQVLVVAGETGSGKSTQLPKLCLAAGLGETGVIGVTQPRRIAATSLAARVAEEMGPDGTRLVGYRVRFRDRCGPDTRIRFMTDGILLAEAGRDPDLSGYSAIIVDEAHERSLNIDFLLGILRRLLPKRPDLRLVITSATIDTERFSAAFSAPVIEVGGRGWPVEIEYRPPGPDDDDYVERAVAAVLDLHSRPDPGDILVFMPTERDIRECVDGIEKEIRQGRHVRAATVLPLFGRLAGRDQQRIFREVPGRKIVVATNVAETSLTVPGIRYVVDTGLARISVYGARSGTAKLPVLPVSRASADQRAGRCGRTGPGLCVRLYSEEDYQSREQFTRPEIQRANLAEVILRMVSLKLGDPASFPFLDPPSGRAISDGFKQLLELGAVERGRNGQVRLTRAGRIMARLPLDPRLSRMIVAARDLGCLAEVTVIAAALSIQDPMIRPAEEEEKADQAHAAFRDPSSDFLTLLNIWNRAGEQKSMGALSRFCRKNFLSFQRMREWQDIHGQIVSIVTRENGFTFNRDRAAKAAIHQAVLAGCLRGIGFRKEKNQYQVAGGRRAMIFPGSSLFNRAGTWVVAAEVVETGRLYLRTVANVKPEWIEEAAAHLCRRHYHSPRWDRKSGRVVALGNTSLFGLALAANRRVDYGRIDPAAAREIFIQSALVEGGLGPGFAFLDRNLALVAELRENEERLRCRGLVADDRQIFSMYDKRLPDWVRDRGSLKRFIARGREKSLVFRRHELLTLTGEGSAAGEDYPGHIEVGGVEFSLEYSFNPGAENDGITVVVPAALAGTVRPGFFEWLVPGMVEEKIIAMLKTLPKAARRRIVPVPETARKLAAMLEPWREPLDAALARALRQSFGLDVTAGDFSVSRVPEHLRPRYRIVDSRGRELAASRDFSAIAASGAENGGKDRAACGCDNQGELDSFRRAGVTDPAEIIGVPDRLPVTRGGRLAGFLFPMLTFDPARREFALDLAEDEEEARRANRAAIPWLYAKRFNNFKTIKKILRLDRGQWAIIEGMGGADGLEESVRAFALAQVFSCDNGVIPGPDEYDAVVERVAAGPLAALAAEMMELATAVLRARREALDVIRNFAARARKGGEGIFAAMEDELGRLVPPGFFDRADAELCRLRLRHLKALAIRAQRAHDDPGRDLKRQALLRPFSARIPAGPPADPDAAAALAEYALMVDEFAVTVFAQELGSAMPVSAARLEEKWREVEPLLRK